MYFQSIKSVKQNAAKSVNRSTERKTAYRVWCLYSSFVHAPNTPKCDSPCTGVTGRVASRVGKGRLGQVFQICIVYCRSGSGLRNYLKAAPDPGFFIALEVKIFLFFFPFLQISIFFFLLPIYKFLNILTWVQHFLFRIGEEKCNFFAILKAFLSVFPWRNQIWQRQSMQIRNTEPVFVVCRPFKEPGIDFQPGSPYDNHRFRGLDFWAP
jgi:hypothetical protein